MAARIVLVRHAEAAAGWGEDQDPGLSEPGRRQAEHLAAALVPAGPLPILVSPLRRARETAAPLERAWGVEAVVDACVGEVPSPVDDLPGRSEWLRTAMAGSWADLGPDIEAWRQRVVDRLAAVTTDTVVVSHYVAINAAVGAATGDDRVVCFRPGNCSQTVVAADSGRLRLVALGEEAATRVL